MKIIVDGQPVSFETGDNLLITMLKADCHPTGGGCLCLGGDCPHCLATVDGVSYIRTCQVKAKPGLVVERHHQVKFPPLPVEERVRGEVKAHNLHCDVVVIGQGESGQAEAQAAHEAGKEVITLDTYQGQEAVGIYPGPLVVARTDEGMQHIHVKDEIVVATGAAELHPIVPGAELAGLVTARAAAQLAEAGIELGRVVAIGTPPDGVEATPISGELVRFEGEGTVSAVVMQDEHGDEHRHECDTVSLGLGFHPRNALFRMGRDWSVRLVGDAAREADIPSCPHAGIVCPCEGTSVEQLEATWNQGFRELELVKRSTLAGTGTCQGSVCIPYLRSFLQAKGKTLQPPFTARPMTRQMTLGEISAGAHHHATPRTGLHDEHIRLGAQMDRIGGWWRPWNYGNLAEEYWAVREAVSLGDVSTLGKMIVTGPNVLEFLERLYPTKVSTIKAGRSRYVLMLDERGYVFDDGLVCKVSDNRYLLTFTSGGSSHAEMWLRDWATGWGLDVRILNQTMSLGAINVTGPLANELLKRAGLEKPLKFMRHAEAEIAGVPCQLYRLSFTGEASYELHHPMEQSVTLWRELMALGADLGIKPHGLETLLRLRLEKGHIIVGQDTDYDSTARRIHHDWAVKVDKGTDFIGRHAVIRTNQVPLDKMLVGFEMDDQDAPAEGTVIYHEGEYIGYVTSSTYSPVLGKSVMLGWLYLVDGNLLETVTISGRSARRVAVPFYDPEGHRAKL